MGIEKKTVNIAIVEDSPDSMKNIVATLDSYGREKGIDFRKRCFGLSTDFLENYSADYDVVFMDIQLPDLDGISAAKRMRVLDKNVVLVFVTNFAQYAINGYEVNAADFIMKPLDYATFAVKMGRILSRISSLNEVLIPVKVGPNTVSVSSQSLKYVEVIGHGLIFHTVHGEIESQGTLYKVEQRLAGANFVRCNNCYLVNLRYVESVNNYTTVVGGDELKVSYARRRDYRKAVAEYLGGGV